MTTALMALAVLALLATLLPLIRGEAWWIRIFDFPRVQVVVLMLAVLAGQWFLLDDPSPVEQTTRTLLVLALLYQCYRMMPYTSLFPKQVPSCPDNGDVPDRLRLLTANVLMTNRNADDLLGLVAERDPDIILLVETDRWWEQSLRPLEADYAYRVRHPLDNTFGMLLYSKLELRESEVRFLVEDDVPSIWARAVLRSGTTFRLIGLHPRPPRPDKNQDSTQRDAELVLTAHELAEVSQPAVVLGDLNDVAWSHTTHLFQRISGLGDPRVGRGFFNSFHADYWFMRYPLDHIFNSSEFRLADLRRLKEFGSDHFPIYAELCYRQDGDDGGSTNEVPEPNGDDFEDARRKVSQALG